MTPDRRSQKGRRPMLCLPADVHKLIGSLDDAGPAPRQRTRRSRAACGQSMHEPVGI